MDLRAQHLSETCSDPIEFLNQLRQTTEPIGGGTVYSEDGELVEYDVAIEAVRKANNAFIKKAKEAFCKATCNGHPPRSTCTSLGTCKEYDNFVKYMKGE